MAPAGLLVLFAMPFTAVAKHDGPGSSPDLNPGDFVRQVDNKFFPLKPGTTFFYESANDGAPTSEEVYVTHQTKQILGVTTTVVHARSFEDGVLVEDTFERNLTSSEPDARTHRERGASGGCGWKPRYIRMNR